MSLLRGPSLPRGSIRVRLACAWPILTGQETLKLLWANNVLDSQHRIEVSRGRVKRLMFRSVLPYPWQGGLETIGFLNPTPTVKNKPKRILPHSGNLNKSEVVNVGTMEIRQQTCSCYSHQIDESALSSYLDGS